MAISAFWRRKVDLPAMFGPVTSQMRPASPSPSRAEVAVVGDEGAAPSRAERLLDHRVAAALDREGERVVDHRPARSSRPRRARRAPAATSSAASASATARIASARPRTAARELVEDVKLDRERPLAGAGDLRLELGELGGGEAHGAGHASGGG